MKKFKWTLFLCAAAVILSTGFTTAKAAVYRKPANTAGSAARAAAYKTPAEIVAELTGRTVEDVMQEWYETGKTYGMIADEAGKLDEFKKECLKIKKDILDQDVEDGLLSQEEADEIYEAIKERQALCDGTGNGQRGYGGRNGYGRGRRNGNGRGDRNGNGRGGRNAFCPYYA